MAERTKAEVGALVRQRMKTVGMTEHRLRTSANVDRKTLLGLLDGTRWPQEDTRLKIELALGWEAGSIQDIRDGGDAALIVAKSQPPPLTVISDDELLRELARRLRAAALASGNFAAARNELQNGAGHPASWLPADLPLPEDPGVLRDEDGKQRNQSGR